MRRKLDLSDEEMALDPIPVTSAALRSLIGGGEAPLPEIIRIDVDSVETDPDQPRQHFDEERLEELAESIRNSGVDQPITVRRVGFERYRLVAGERRLRAAKRAGLAAIPALVRNQFTDEEMELFRLRENLLREGLTPLEEARGLRRVKEITKRTWKEIGAAFGWKENTVLQKVRLLDAPERVRELIEAGKLTASHYSRISSLPEEQQVRLAERAVEEGWSFRNLRDALLENAGAFPEQASLYAQGSSSSKAEPVSRAPANGAEPGAAPGGGLWGGSGTAGHAQDGDGGRPIGEHPGETAAFVPVPGEGPADGASPSPPPPAEGPSSWRPPSPTARRVYETIKMTVTVPGDVHAVIAGEMEALKIKAYADYLRLCVDEHLRSKGLLPDPRSSG